MHKYCHYFGFSVKVLQNLVLVDHRYSDLVPKMKMYLVMQVKDGPMVQVRLCAAVTVPAITVSTDTLQFDTMQCGMCQVQYSTVTIQRDNME